MKKLLPSAAKVIVLDASGSSYEATLEYGYPKVNVAIVDATGASYNGAVDPKNSLNIALVDATGASYLASISTVDAINTASTEVIVDPPHVDVVVDYATGWYYKTPEYTPQLERSLNTEYDSGFTEELLNFAINSFVQDETPLIIEETIVGFSDYISATYDIANKLSFSYTIPGYRTKLLSAPVITYGIAAPLKVRFGFSEMFLTEHFKYAKTVSYYAAKTALRVPVSVKTAIASPLRVRFEFVPSAIVTPLKYTATVKTAIITPLRYRFELSKAFWETHLKVYGVISYYQASSALRFTATIRTAIASPLKYVATVDTAIATPLKQRFSFSNIFLKERFSVEQPVSYYNWKVLKATKNVSYHSTIGLDKSFDVSYDITNFDRITKAANVSYVCVETIEILNAPLDITTIPIPSSLSSDAFPTGTTMTPNVDGTTTILTPTGLVYTQLINGDIIPQGHTGTNLGTSQGMDILAVEPMLVVDGAYVFVTDMSISVDEGNFTYTLDAKLGNYADMTKFLPSGEFYAVLQGEIYSFIVDSRSINRQDVNAPVASIKGVSLANLYTGNRSKQIIGTTFSEGGSSRELALKVLTDPYINRHSQHLLDPALLSWEILDWEIPPFRFGVENTYPLDGIKTIVEAVGGVVESYPDGRIRARYKHPTRVPDYSDETAAHSFFDVDDIFSIEEQYAPNRKVNSIYVKTYQDIGVSDQIEFFDTPGLANVQFGGFVRVFPAFWRDTVELTTTREWDVTLEYLGVELWRPGEIDPPDFGWETIEIVRSQGSTKYPIHSIVGYEYLNVDCGDIVLQDYNKTFYTKSETERFSLLKLSYLTKCHKWRVSAPGGAHIQFLIKDNVFNSYLR